MLVGLGKFEFPTSASQTQNHTKLDHNPNKTRKSPNLSLTDNHFKGKIAIKIVQTQQYIKAGKIAAEVREMVRVKDWIGKTVFEVCESVENEIKKRGAKCAFPVNASINEIAAHYTAEPDDPITIKDTDLVKIDLGAQIDGYIADTAVTVCYDVQYDGLVQAAEEALKNAMSMAKAGVKASDIGRTIEDTIKQRGFRPIANLSGHSLGQYTIHAGKSIPNIWSIGGFSLAEDTAYACEPFVTTEQGGGFVRNGKIKNIFALNSRKKTKNLEADRMLDFIWKNHNMLPFALRWLVKEWEVKEASELLEFLVKKKAVQAYPILVEVNEQRVAQAEHTFIPELNRVTVTTKAP